MIPLVLRPELGLPRPPAALETLLARCFEKDPALRYPDMRALAAALRTSIGAVRRMRGADTHPETAGTRTMATRQSSRFDHDTLPFTTIGVDPPRPSRARWIGYAVLSLLALLLGAWWMVRA
jgi:hypothetical protein